PAQPEPGGRAAAAPLRACDPKLRSLYLVRHPLPEAGGGPRVSVNAPAKVTLVIGVGNEWRRDDAAGLVVAAPLPRPPPPRGRAIRHEGEPLDLLEEWSGYAAALVLDAVSSGAEPGTIHRLDA